MLKNLHLVLLFYTVLLLHISCDKPKPKFTNIEDSQKLESVKENTFIIRGSTFGYDNKLVYLFEKVDSKLKLIDSTLVSNNKFEFKGSVVNPAMYNVSRSKQQNGFSFLIDNSEIDLFLNSGQELSTSFSKSTIQQEYLAYQAKMKSFKDASIKQYYALQGDFSKNNIARLKKERKIIFTNENEYTENFITNHPDSYYALMLLQDRLETNSEASNRKLYNALSLNAKDLPIAKAIDSVLTQKAIETKLVEAQHLKTTQNQNTKSEYRPKAYPLSGPNTNGQNLSLAALKGKVVLVDFWASWCAPCRATNPNLVNLHRKYKDRGFVVFSVSEDKGEPEWLSAIQADNLTWNTHILDKNKTNAFRYGVKSIPYKLLIDKQGRIASGNISGKKLENKLVQLLNE